MWAVCTHEITAYNGYLLKIKLFIRYLSDIYHSGHFSDNFVCTVGQPASGRFPVVLLECSITLS